MAEATRARAASISSRREYPARSRATAPASRRGSHSIARALRAGLRHVPPHHCIVALLARTRIGREQPFKANRRRLARRPARRLRRGLRLRPTRPCASAWRTSSTRAPAAAAAPARSACSRVGPRAGQRELGVFRSSRANDIAGVDVIALRGRAAPARVPPTCWAPPLHVGGLRFAPTRERGVGRRLSCRMPRRSRNQRAAAKVISLNKDKKKKKERARRERERQKRRGTHRKSKKTRNKKTERKKRGRRERKSKEQEKEQINKTT